MSDYYLDETVMDTKLKRMLFDRRVRQMMEQDAQADPVMLREASGNYRYNVYTEDRIGTAIRTSRAIRRLSQTELADLANVNQTYLSKIEGGQTKVSVALLCDICEALGLRLSELFYILEESSHKKEELPLFRYDEKTRLFLKMLSVIVDEEDGTVGRH